MSRYRPEVLVVDDDAALLNFLTRSLKSLGFKVVTCRDGAGALDQIEHRVFDVVLTDLKMPKMDGIELLAHIQQTDAPPPVIVMTGFASVGTAVEAMKLGATDYLTKPVDLDHLEIVLNRTVSTTRQRAESALLRAQVEEMGTFEGMVGVSDAMQSLYERIRRVARTDAAVLIQGETGSGKEMVARAIHRLSPRSEGPFVPVNCGALTESLVETELFGHEKGSFTGAHQTHRGVIEQAQGGTLLLDEVEDMTAAMQVRLLRVLEDGKVQRVGGEETLPVDFRLVCAAQKDLGAPEQKEAIRQDLFYRISTVRIAVPPLLDRLSDIPLLARRFVEAAAHAHDRETPTITPEAMMALQTYGWPGNVRELRNVIDEAVVLTEGHTIGVDDLPETLVPEGKPEPVQDAFEGASLKAAREAFERRYIETLLEATGGNVSEAARRAGVNRQHLHQKIKRLGIR